MEHRPLGSTHISSVVLGCSNFGRLLSEPEAERLVAASLDLGITAFDVAEDYGRHHGHAETVLGRALGRRRHRAVVLSKVALDPERPVLDVEASIRAACTASLARLGTDHLEVLQLHRPHPHLPVDEVAGAFDALIAEGLIAMGGFSITPAEDLVALPLGSRAAAVVQVEYSALCRSAEHTTLPRCGSTSTALLAYYPLAYGLLTGKYRRGAGPPQGSRLDVLGPALAARWLTEANLTIIDSLVGLCEETGWTMTELALSWLLGRPGVTAAVLGAMSADQLRRDLAAVRPMQQWLIDAVDRCTEPALARASARGSADHEAPVVVEVH